MTYYSEHREERKAYGKRYYSDHGEERKAYGKRYYSDHGEEIRAYARARPYKPRTKEQNRVHHRRQRRGVGKEEFYFMLDAQDNKCAICGTPIADDQFTHTDHNHANGWPRGLLCAGCNNGIGFLRDDPTICRAAARYLDETV